MNRLIQWMMAAILICGASVLTSCTNDDKPVDPTKSVHEFTVNSIDTNKFIANLKVTLTNKTFKT